MDNLNSPLWKRALLAANGEIPLKIIEFINNLIAEANIAPPLFSIARPEDDVAQLRDKVESLNRELFNAELEFDLLLRAMTLSKENIQRIVEHRDNTLSRINRGKSRVVPQIPKEIVLKIAGYVPWTDWYSDRKGSSSLRRMARAFSVAHGMEDAILRKIPLVVSDLLPAHWTCGETNLPKGHMDIIGTSPRLCRYDDEDTISRVTANEEVYLTLPSESHASNISNRVFQTLSAARLHLSLIDSTAHGFRDFKKSFLNQKTLPRISSLIVQRRDAGRWSRSREAIQPHSTSPIVTDDISVLERARFSLRALQDYLPIPQHLAVLEITFPSDLKDLAIVVNVLRTIHSSLQSLHLVGYGGRAYGDTLYKGVAFETEAMQPVVFPDLQELSLGMLQVADAFALLSVLDCPSLTSLNLGRLEVWVRSSPRTGGEPRDMFANKIITKFPRLSRLVYVIGRASDDISDDFTFHKCLLGLLEKPRESEAEHSVWHLPRLRELQVEVQENEAEFLIPFVSARLASRDVASLKRIHLEVLEQHLQDGLSEKWPFQNQIFPHLNSLRVLVPEVVYQRMKHRD